MIQMSELMTDDCRDWKRKQQAGKTWNNFKTHFSRAYNKLKDTVDTAQSAGYHVANAVQEHTVQALNNLANATMTDKETMDNLADTITSLNQQLVTTNAKLSQVMSMTTAL